MEFILILHNIYNVSTSFTRAKYNCLPIIRVNDVFALSFYSRQQRFPSCVFLYGKFTAIANVYFSLSKQCRLIFIQSFNDFICKQSAKLHFTIATICNFVFIKH